MSRAAVALAVALAAACATAPSRPARIVELTPHGELIDLEAALVPGYVTVIDFHAAWCARCTTVDADLRAAADRDPAIVIRRVDIGDGLTPIARAYRIRTLPHVLIVDRGGVLRHRLIGEDALAAGRRALAVAATGR